MKNIMINLLTAVVVAAFTITVGYLMGVAYLDYGPNCPGMDPSWQGKCEIGEYGEN